MKDLITYIEQATAQWKQDQGKSLEASVLLRGAVSAADAILAKAKELAQGSSSDSAPVPEAPAAPKKARSKAAPSGS